MSTPIEEIVLPYGVTVEGDGSWYPKIVGDHPKKASNAGLWLPAGPCRVAFSWDGANAADLVLANGSTVKRPARVESGTSGVPRSAIVTIAGRSGDRVEINVNSKVGEVGTIEVYPMPT